MDFEYYYKRLPLYCTVCDIIQQHPDGITDLELKSLLEAKGILLDDKDFFGVISDLLTYEGSIQRDDYWNQGAVYSYIDSSRLRNSSYSRHHYSFTVDDCVSDKIFVHMADTHIGNPEFEDFRMLDSLYDFVIGEGATVCFLLGDQFHGPKDKNKMFSKEEMLNQLNSFISFYPNPSPREMRTYANIGNHDEFIQGFFHPRVDSRQRCTFDLRRLNSYRPSYFVIPREKFIINFPNFSHDSNISMHFSHRLYFSWIRPDVKISGLDDLAQENRWLDNRYDVLWSAHLHNGFIYSSNFSFAHEKQSIYLGVPSTSKYNLGRVVAYLSHLHYEKGSVSSMDVDFLRCDNNYHITKEEGVHWNFSGNNKVYQKVL